ncbi:DUF1304 domain-containing protein [Leucobacter allii]|uniref:DUF1304 domain-containing protein n=1 Tax=Leucobacter allii TaxID=2932247 RepID=A0ABY4FNW3_9MICO|nr:DUF1304 domain-containing protein [Leucobacter allii]UOQ57899.1 DUF1304 domain-containing protein [Leucobacter allii]
MIVAGWVLAALAALLHGYIFYLESVAWASPRARAVFGTTAEEAAATRELAYNQGFYNLFLAILVVLGLALGAAEPAVGLALVLAGTGSMLAAALVLGISSPAKRGAAVKQGALPLLAVAALTLGSLLG